MWVATKWDYLFIFFFGMEVDHVLSTLRLRLRLGIVSGVGHTQN